MSSSRTLSRKFRTFFTCIKPRFDPSIILLYIAASVEQYCDITQVNALPENEGILEEYTICHYFKSESRAMCLTGKPDKNLINPENYLLMTYLMPHFHETYLRVHKIA